MSGKDRISIERKRFEEIYRELEGLQYGSIEVVVHDGQIVEVTRHEKKRFPLKKFNDTVG